MDWQADGCATTCSGGKRNESFLLRNPVYSVYKENESKRKVRSHEARKLFWKKIAGRPAARSFFFTLFGGRIRIDFRINSI